MYSRSAYQFARGKEIPHDATVLQRGLDAGGPQGLTDRCQRDQILPPALQKIKLEGAFSGDAEIRGVIQHEYSLVICGIHLAFLAREAARGGRYPGRRERACLPRAFEVRLQPIANRNTYRIYSYVSISLSNRSIKSIELVSELFFHVNDIEGKVYDKRHMYIR